MTMIDISNISKAKLLAGLYNNSKPLGRGIMAFSKDTMSEEDAQKIVDQRLEQTGKLSFDYLDGRVLKVDISSDEMDPWLYDRDVGHNAAQGVVDKILANIDIESNVSESDIDKAAETAKNAKISIMSITGDVRGEIYPDKEHIKNVQKKLDQLKNG